MSASPAAVARRALAVLAPMAVLAFLLVASLAPSLAAPVARSPVSASAPHAGVEGPSLAALHEAVASARPTPAVSGTDPAINFSASFQQPGPVSYTSPSGEAWSGPAPLTVYQNVTIFGSPATYSYSVNWDDGSSTQYGNVTVGAGSYVILGLTHFYSIAASFVIELDVNSTLLNSSFSSGTAGLINVYGAAGPAPVVVAVNTTVASVPAPFNFTAEIGGAPANAVAEWSLDYGPGDSLTYNGTLWNSTEASFTPVVTIPTFSVLGILVIAYPGTGYPGLQVRLGGAPQRFGQSAGVASGVPSSSGRLFPLERDVHRRIARSRRLGVHR